MPLDLAKTLIQGGVVLLMSHVVSGPYATWPFFHLIYGYPLSPDICLSSINQQY